MQKITLFKPKANSLVLLLACLGLAVPRTEAKLGENISKLKQVLGNNFTAKGDSVKDNKHYYMFTMNIDKEVMRKIPEFSGGLTITTSSNGTIIGQSMLMNLGRNEMQGRAMASIHALDFTAESLGRQLPNNPVAARKELDTFGNIVYNALAGHPQNIRFPNVRGKVVVSRQANGSLALAATPE